MDNQGRKLTRVKDGVTVTVETEGDGARRKSFISLSGSPSKRTIDAVAKLQSSSFDPAWVMNQVVKTI